MNNDAVAELAFGHIIFCDRCITTNTQHLCAGEWRKKLGLVGHCNIDKSMIRIAKGVDMNVIVWSHSFSPEEAKELGVEYASIFVNTSRGEIVGVDVFEGEPAAGIADFPMKELAVKVTSATCHVDASTNQTADKIANKTVRAVNAFISTGAALNCVNINASPKADGVLTVRHTGVFAKIIEVCDKIKATIFSVQNTVIKGDKSQTCVLRIQNPGSS